MNIDRKKVKEKLEEHLNRQSSDDEVTNAANDVNILLKILWEKVETLEKKII